MVLLLKRYPKLLTSLELLWKTKDIKQKECWHPEIYVLNHSLQVFKWAVRESGDIDLIIAALFHDIGKSVMSLGHDGTGYEILKENKMPDKVLWLVKHHMRVYDYINGEMQGLKKCKYLADHLWLPALIQLARWDRKGRNAASNPKYTQADILYILQSKL